MHLSLRELWTALHGMILGSVFLLAFAGGLEGLWSLRSDLVTEAGVRERMRRIVVGTWAMAIVAWLTVIVGTYEVYPWYRAKPAAAPKVMTVAALHHYPRSYLLSKQSTAEWHAFGMEWKEHVAWLAPILATVVAIVVTWYRRRLIDMPEIRRMLLALYCLAFFAAAIAGVLGAFINKAAPTQ